MIQVTIDQPKEEKEENKTLLQWLLFEIYRKKHKKSNLNKNNKR